MTPTHAGVCCHLWGASTHSYFFVLLSPSQKVLQEEFSLLSHWADSGLLWPHVSCGLLFLCWLESWSYHFWGCTKPSLRRLPSPGVHPSHGLFLLNPCPDQLDCTRVAFQKLVTRSMHKFSHPKWRLRDCKNEIWESGRWGPAFHSSYPLFCLSFLPEFPKNSFPFSIQKNLVGFQGSNSQKPRFIRCLQIIFINNKHVSFFFLVH